MHTQGQAPDGEPHQGRRTPRNAMQKISSSTSRNSCPRMKRCCVLEPVLEHFELSTCPAARTLSVSPKGTSTSSSSPLRLLTRLRDGYVKLMNEVASGADFAGVSSFYGAGHGTVGTGDNAAVAMAATRRNCSKEATRVGSLTQTAGA